MTLYLYCVTPAGHEPPSRLLGLDDAAVATVAHDDLALWVSSIPTGSLRAGLDAVRRHNDVVEAAVTSTITPIPLRFGQHLASPAEVRERVAREQERWRAQLALFSGALEFGVRVIDPTRRGAAQDVHTPPEPGGRAYLEQLAQRHASEREARAQAERVAEALRDAVGGMALSERVEPLRSGHGVASIAHLVPRVLFTQYRERIAEARGALKEMRLLVSGPWPPYSFAG